MKKFNLYSYIKPLALFFFIAIIGVACSNSTSGEEEEHHDPEGFVLKMNGQSIVQQLPGQDLSGEFELIAGEETDLITLFFINDEGEEFQPDEPEHSLGYQFETEGIAEFEQHDDDGKWSFHLHAESEGITELQLMLMHGDHSDFTTQGIHVHVENQVQ